MSFVRPNLLFAGEEFLESGIASNRISDRIDLHLLKGTAPTFCHPQFQSQRVQTNASDRIGLIVLRILPFYRRDLWITVLRLKKIHSALTEVRDRECALASTEHARARGQAVRSPD